MVSCFSQFIQREEVGDRAAVAAGEQRAAVHSPAGVGGQHRALEEAVLSLQGGERPAEGQGSRTCPQESCPCSQLPPPLLFLLDLCSFLAVCVRRWVWSWKGRWMGSSGSCFPLHTAGREGSEELPHHVEFPALGFGRLGVSRACWLG